MKPYYEHAGVKLFCGDSRELIHEFPVESVITDPIWPNSAAVFPGVEPRRLLEAALLMANDSVRRVVIHLGREKVVKVKEQIEQTARVCHEANRAYCATLGDFTQLPWDEANQWQRDSAIKGVEFHIANLSAGIKPIASASHDSWLAEKRATGWKFGPVKDANKKEHPCFVRYEELPVDQRLKDYIFAAICEAFFQARTTEVGV